jgi:hypothetical protein
VSAQYLQPKPQPSTFKRGANLYNTSLTGANFTGANFTGANLTVTNFTGANLTGTNLTCTTERYETGEPAFLRCR